MRKIYLFTAAILCAVFSFGQTHSVAKNIQGLIAQNKEFQSFDLFSKSNDVSKMSKYQNAASDVTVLDLNSTVLESLISAKSDEISFSVPYQNEEVELKLYRVNLFADDFQARDENGGLIDYSPGLYYRGIIGDNFNSVAAFSFFENKIMGIMSSGEFGNLNLGKTKSDGDLVVYSDKNLSAENPFECGVDELKENQEYISQFTNDMLSKTLTENCVRIYYEIAYQPYLNNGSDETETLDWLSGIHNNISTLYSNDDITISLSEVMIWTSDDPYDGDYGENLDEFRTTRTVFNGDLGHLVNYPSTTSVAYLNSLCGDYRYAYSGIDMYYEEVPTYSWTIMAMTHETGHALGSPHTHACAWNGDNTAIDGCGPYAGYGEGCDGELPDGGGTIMSYCHLTPVGINLSAGFGPQPAALIRSTVDSKPCLGSDCITSCVPTVEGVELNFNTQDAQVEVTILDDVSESWGYVVYPYGGSPGAWTDISTPTFEITGLDDHQYYELQVGNVCENGVYGNVIKRLILLGDFCEGETFSDTGGENGDYGNDQYLVKTFYPSSPDEKVALTFTEFDLEWDYDFMYIYNGNSEDSPLFPGGNQLSGDDIPGPFVSTSDDGSITVKFISDSYVTENGWEASVNCASLGIEDLSKADGLNVYPNPATTEINIDSRKEIVSVKLNDTSGKLIYNQKVFGLQSNLSIEKLPPGVYILTIQLKDTTISKKIIKN